MATEKTSSRPWSCDTFLVAPDRQSSGVTLLGKNSDRPAGECQPLRFLPSRTGGGQLQLAYVAIPDVEKTYAHLGASPYWCWGHELGLNEKGVSIGNEASFTRTLADAITRSKASNPDDFGILGMELLRIGLERAATADEALDIMTSLLEEYGQWGTGVGGEQPEEGAYDNSYIIADATGGWVLETAGRHWAARRIDSGTCSISNQATIRNDADRLSAGLAEYVAEQGWGDPEAQEFDFARSVIDPLTPLQASYIRLQRSRDLLSAGLISEARAMSVLRDHYEGTFLEGTFFTPALPDLLSICMHESPAGFTWGNTASSMVCTIPSDGSLARLWWAPGTPCTSVYIPLWVEAGTVPTALSAAGKNPGEVRPPEDATPDGYADGSYWWRFLYLLETAKDSDLSYRFNERQPKIAAAFSALETRWLADVPGVEAKALAASPAEKASILAEYTQSCADEALAVLAELLADFGAPASPGDGFKWA